MGEEQGEKGESAVHVMGKELYPPIPKRPKGKHTRASAQERRRRLAEVEFRLMDQRENLSQIRAAGDCRLYAEGLIEYSRLLGIWEDNLTCEIYRNKQG